MTSTGGGSGQPFPIMADAVRVATENAADLWRAGADALAAQVEAMRRSPPPYPVPGLEQYLDLLRQATDANRELADRWVTAVRTMTAALVPDVGGSGTDQADQADPTDSAGQADRADRTDSAGHDGGADRPADPAPTRAEAAPATAPAEAAPAPAPAPAESAHAPAPAPAKAHAEPSPAEPSPDEPATAVPAAQPRSRRPTSRPRPTATAASPASAGDSGDPRAAYLRMGKATLSARLAARGLPRSGTLAQLADRLLAAEAADRAAD